MIKTAKRWATAISSSLSMITAGSLFSFSVLSEGLKAQLSYTSSDLNTISGVGNSALYISFLFIGPIFDLFGAQWTMLFGVIFYGLGYLLMYLSFNGLISGSTGAMAAFYFLAGTGSTCCYMGTIGQNVKNFATKSSGKVVGILLLFYGLSGVIYSQMYSAFYLNNTSGYLLFLTLTVAIVNFICCFTTFDVPPEEAMVAPEKDLPKPHALLEKSAAGSLESLGSIPEVLMIHHTVRRKSASLGSDTLAASMALRAEAVKNMLSISQLSPRASKTSTSQMPRGSKSRKPRKRDIVVESNVSIQMEEEIHDKIQKQQEEEEEAPLEDDGGVRDLSPLEILKSHVFWFYALTFVFMQGLTYFTNLYSILQAALGQTMSDTALSSKNTVHVTILSVFQALGRITCSLILDAMASSEKVTVDRSLLLFVSQMSKILVHPRFSHCLNMKEFSIVLAVTAVLSAAVSAAPSTIKITSYGYDDNDDGNGLTPLLLKIWQHLAILPRLPPMRAPSCGKTRFVSPICASTSSMRTDVRNLPQRLQARQLPQLSSTTVPIKSSTTTTTTTTSSTKITTTTSNPTTTAASTGTSAGASCTIKGAWIFSFGSNPDTRQVAHTSQSRTVNLGKLPFSFSSRSLSSDTESFDSAGTLKLLAQTSSQIVGTISRNMNIVTNQEDWASMEKELKDLENEVKSDTIWEEDPQRAIVSQKRISVLENRLKEYNEFKARAEEALSMFEMAKEENDVELFTEVQSDLESLSKDLDKYSMQIMMTSPSDKSSCFMEIRAGAGGTEACDWVGIVARMYERWGTNEGYKVTILDQTRGEAGFKSITIQFAGDYAYGWCKYETGIHRFVRISKYGEVKRQTSFASIQVFPLDTENADANAQSFLQLDIPANDIKFEAMRSQGAGGQHVNKTESAVRITHLPTGIVVQCQHERSQHQNKAMAMQMLRARLQQRHNMAQQQLKSDAHSSLAENAWGSQIRSYVIQPYQMIKDLRTSYERSDVDNVFDGDLQEMLEASVLHFNKRK
ncbi:UNVERIFIED_CONTAM: hypothetical protein HDU68_009857 [Siphonaria sp. JEL0065]|nr:hypothetical protein HDU68_009857 [Siphonaria sp. JEL0065]